METEQAYSNRTLQRSMSSTKNSTDATKRLKWISAEVTKLGVAFSSPLNAPQLALYVEHLQDLADDTLAVAFNRAVRELKFFPKVSEIRELAGAGNTDTLESDTAWSWICDWLKRHGSSGYTIYILEDPRMECRGKSELDSKVWQRHSLARSKFRQEHGTIDDGYRDEEYSYATVDAPEIPGRIRYALRQLACDENDGLRRISAARDDPKESGFVRREFVAAFLR